ncbi:hypothetical protein OsJ_29810 [Oryza sativa Japonica Group]|uniref:Uncharacterized protein n=1 Tax=Oryza sativa subsp. japonica TaxID=39947 RepID=B9G491_ORYSJ|nr:hypothetical protein OsJ_29810 [Oryza sativa Japonica Group]
MRSKAIRSGVPLTSGRLDLRFLGQRTMLRSRARMQRHWCSTTVVEMTLARLLGIKESTPVGDTWGWRRRCLAVKSMSPDPDLVEDGSDGRGTKEATLASWWMGKRIQAFRGRGRRKRERGGDGGRRDKDETGRERETH